MKTYWISEIGSNHNNDLDRCIELIKASKGAGFDAVKFQLFKAEKLYAPEMVKQIAMMKARELPVGWIPVIRNVCDDNGLDFICSPFDEESLDALETYVDAYKIAAFEAQDVDLVKACYKTGKPVYISCGLLGVKEVKDMLELVIGAGDQTHLAKKSITLMHCVSKYPALPEECCLSRIEYLNINSPSGLTGWSDHTADGDTVLSAVMHGARVVEMHFDLEDGLGCETSLGHCWKTEKAWHTIQTIKNLEKFSPGVLDFMEERKWRRDPSDKLRPMKEFRGELSK